MGINPDSDGMQRLIAEDPGGPVVMVNLLRFAEGGREAYVEFTRTRSMTLLARYGGEVIYAGNGSTVLAAVPDQNWDAVLIVRYPSRDAFRRMLADPDFAGLNEVRAATLDATLLQATVPW
jgi:uncharacterized protein (DUF1330 family)